MSSSVDASSGGARVRNTLGNITFVTQQAFLSNPRAAGLVAAMTITLAMLPSAQVIATAALIGRLRDGHHLPGVVGPLLVVVAAVGLSGPLQSARSAIAERSMLSTEVALQSRLAGIVANLSPSRMADAKVAAEVEGHSRAIIDAVSHVYGETAAGVGAVVSAAGVVVTLAVMSPIAGMLVVLAAVPAALAGKYVGRAIERMWKVLGAIYQRDRYLRDTMSRQRSITELASLGTTHRLAAMVSAHQHRIEETRNIPINATIRAQTAVGTASTVLLGGAVVAVIIGMNYGPTAVAGVYGVVAAMGATAEGSLVLSKVLQFLPQTGAVRRFFDEAPPDFRQTIAPRAAELVVSGLTHRYANRTEDAVADIDLKAQQGEMIALVGVNGAGKTTIVNAVLGLIEASGGQVTVDGRTRDDLGEAAWLGQFGLLTQEFGRYEFSVRETVALGTPEDEVCDERIWAALDAAHAGEFVRAMPHGLDTQLGEQWNGVGISGGQWQRLALARIHLRGAPIWILDEPTSAIDAEAEQEVFAELGRTKDGRISIVVSHRAWTLRGMDRIYVIDSGAVVECGTYEELMRAEGRFAKIFAEQG
ncbi:ATP-binding cassette domain-containing protein [Streptomyces sp. NPDC002577]